MAELIWEGEVEGKWLGRVRVFLWDGGNVSLRFEKTGCIGAGIQIGLDDVAYELAMLLVRADTLWRYREDAEEEKDG